MSTATVTDGSSSFQSLRSYLYVQIGHAGRLPPGRLRLATKPTSTGSTATRRRWGSSQSLPLPPLRTACHRPQQSRPLDAEPVQPQYRQPIVLSICPTIVDLDVLALDVTGLFQPLSEGAQTVFVQARRGGAERTDYRHRRLLRSRHDRPGDRNLHDRSVGAGSVSSSRALLRHVSTTRAGGATDAAPKTGSLALTEVLPNILRPANGLVGLPRRAVSF